VPYRSRRRFGKLGSGDLRRSLRRRSRIDRRKSDRKQDRVETKTELRRRVAHLAAAARDLGRRKGIDLDKPIESLVSSYEYRCPEYVIPPKQPPRR